MLLALFLHLALSADIKDGETRTGILSLSFSTSVTYSFTPENIIEDDLYILVTLFSDYSDPFLYYSNSSDISQSNYLFFSTSRNEANLKISKNILQAGTSYIMLYCQHFCMYRLSVSQSSPINIESGVPVSNSLAKNDSLTFSFKYKADSPSTLVSLRYFGDIVMYVTKNDEFVSENNTLEVNTNWIDDLEFKANDLKKDDVIYIQIISQKTSHFSIVLTQSEQEPIMIQACQVNTGTVGYSELKPYYIELTEQASSLDISMTVYRGDADIYLSFSIQPDPKNYDFASASIGNDFIRLTKDDFDSKSFVAGKIFISVHGAQDSTFSFVIRVNKNSAVMLEEGVPLESSLSKSDIQSFYFILPQRNQDLSVILTTFNGDADLYVKFCQNKCSILKQDLNSEGVFSSIGPAALQTLDFSYVYDKECTEQSCHLLIAVYGRNDSYFSVLVNMGGDRIVLQQGKSFIMSSPAPAVKYYEYSVTNLVVTQVDFILTPVYGDPDLCVTLNNESSLFCEKSSEKNGIEADHIVYTRTEDNETLTGVYYISVNCRTGCYYSIVARETIPDKNSSIHLISGHPQKDVVFNKYSQTYRVYYFEVGYEMLDIKIIFSRHSGSFRVYVANTADSIDWDKDLFYYFWVLDTELEDDGVLLIHASDQNYLTNSTYLVLVSATSFPSDNTASYTLQYTQGEDILMLTSDVPVSGHIKEYEYSYYSFPIHYNKMDLRVVLTVNSGDPDLYISLDYTNSHPGKEKYSISSNTFGSETVTLLWDQEIIENCPELRQEYSYGMSHGCFLYISVYSEYPSSYSLRVSPNSNLPKFVKKGEQVQMSISQNDYEFFFSYAESTENLIISLQNIEGESELLVNIEDRFWASADISELKRPTEEHCLISLKNLLTESVEVSSEELKKICGSCIVLISVKCLSKSCSFLLEHSQENITKLIEGQPKYGSTGESYEYFSYVCDKEENIVVVVTPIDSCDPSLYVSKGLGKYPSSSLFDWASESMLGESIIISPRDKLFETQSMTGVYLIAVKSEKGLCSFTITITNHATPLVMLSPGVPHIGVVNQNDFTYFAIHNNLAEQITFSLTPSSGSPYFVVSTHSDKEKEVLSDLPTDSYYIWNSNFNKDKYSLTLSSQDPNFCTLCYYLIGVTSDSASSFFIRSSTETNRKVLQSGVPVKAEIKLGSFHLYYFYTSAQRRLHIGVSEYSGQVDFGVSLIKDSTDFNWKAKSGYKTKSVMMELDDKNYISGTYYIVLSSVSAESVYSIVWYSEESYISLVSGWPVIYAVYSNALGSVNFRFDHSGSVYCSMETLTQDSYPSLISYKQNKKSKEISLILNQNRLNYTGSHLTANLDISQGDVLLLHVKNYEQKNFTWTEFSLFCTNFFHPGALTLGVPTLGHVDSKKMALRYEISSPSVKSFDIFITPCFGNVLLFASSNWTQLRDDSNILASGILTNGIIFGRVKDFVGQLYLTVQKAEDAKLGVFRLLVDDKQLDFLYPGEFGFISWEYLEDKISLKWSGLEYANKTGYKGRVKYHIFFTENLTVPIDTSCQLHFAASRFNGRWLDSTENTTISIKLESEGMLTILALIDDPGKVALTEVVYQKLKIEGTADRTMFMKLLFVMSLIVAILAICGGVFFVRLKIAKNEMKVFKDHGKQLDVVGDTVMDPAFK